MQELETEKVEMEKARRETINSQMMIDMMAWIKATKEELEYLKRNVNKSNWLIKIVLNFFVQIF